MNRRIPHFTLTDRLIILVSTGLAAEVLPLMLVTIPSALLPPLEPLMQVHIPHRPLIKVT